MTEPNRSATEAWDDEGVESQPVVPWTREQVQALEQRQPMLSPWRVVAVQALVGVVLVVVWALLGSMPRVQAVSALWGAVAVVLPSAVMAWGLRRRSAQPAAALLGFFVWELVKIGLTVAILVAAVMALPALSWSALLVSLIGCLKVHVWGLWALRQTN